MNGEELISKKIKQRDGVAIILIREHLVLDITEVCGEESETRSEPDILFALVDCNT